MNRGKLPIALVLAFAAACADNRSSIEIGGRAAPSDATSCKFTGSGEIAMDHGVLDVAYTELSYSLAVYVKNNLTDPVMLNPDTTTSSKTWTAQRARVRVNPASYISSSSFNPPLLAYSGENVLPLDGSPVTVNTKSVQLVDAVSHPLGLEIAAAAGAIPAGESRTIVLGITLEGLTYDGQKLDTAEWYYPVEVCSGCLPIPQVLVGGILTACSPEYWLATNCYGIGQDSPPACLVQ